MYYFLVALISYLIGSIPVAYILLRKTKGIDITRNGSGNVGAMNAYETTDSKIIGIIVLVLDLLKGILVVYLAGLFFPGSFLYPAVSLLAAVIGHCYSVWLKFKGGRGLATAAGGLLLFIPHLVILWLIFWLIAYLFRKNIHFANSVALVLLGFLSFTSRNVLAKYSFPKPETPVYYGLFTIVLFSVIMSKHIFPLISYFKEEKKKFKRDGFYEKK